MELKTEVTVLGMKRSKGTFEGVAFDSTRIFVEETLGANNEDVRGCAVVTHKLGDSTEFEKYAQLTFPLRAELAIEFVATGKGDSRAIVKGMRPLKPLDRKVS